MEHSIPAFVAAARHYCALVEGEQPNESSIFEKECLIALLQLYQQVLSLPPASSITDELPKEISIEDWKTLRIKTAERIVRDYYWEVFQPFGMNKPDPLIGSISDDLADIWHDVKAGLLTFDSGAPNCVDEAVWHWRFSFESHWHHHVAGAIRALTVQSIQST